MSRKKPNRAMETDAKKARGSSPSRLGRFVRTTLVIALLLFNSAFAAEPTLVPPDMTVAELIDDLVNIDAQAPGLHSTAWVRGFIAEEQVPEFGGGVIGSAAPTIFPQMRELVRRGIGALPLLIEHLDDSRPTKLTVGGEFFGFAYFAEEYDPKSQAKQARKSWADRLLDDKYRIPDQKYRVRVGDVCYALIGQIVNRNLIAVRYQHTAGFIVNSPIRCPSLIKQVKRDWGNIDAKGHMASLVSDARVGRDARSFGNAFQRLRFYYPEEYSRQAAGTLKQQIHEFELREEKQKPSA